MKHDEIVFAITIKDIQTALSKRLGEKEAHSLSEAEINLARDEVRAVIDHNLDVRDYIDMGLDAWEITRTF